MSENSLDSFISYESYSWINQLNPDPDTNKYSPNQSSREVKSGHYVLVNPTPLPKPKLICFSTHLIKELNLKEEDCLNDKRFLLFFSGYNSVFEDNKLSQSWATPYALSIYGTDYIHNCPFKTGNGYGDGRAISIAEVELNNNKRWEFQLKGAGKTPFCRSGDGRAVLRSSVREFLASEAMYHLGISTTRALSLIVSQSETVKRQWYKERYQILEDNPVAITCRVAPSFLRVGHIQLFERRTRNDITNKNELELIVKHALFREYNHIYSQNDLSLQDKILLMLKDAANRFIELTSNWIRVGFCQGNFNSDNCLISGRTMDYGPFGFIEVFKPLWNMWEGGGEHFGFLNQTTAAYKNFISFKKAVEPLLNAQGIGEAQEIVDEFPNNAKLQMLKMWSSKLGFTGNAPPILIKDTLEILYKSASDYTLFWRQLSYFPCKFIGNSSYNEDDLLDLLKDCYYTKPSSNITLSLILWLKTWLSSLEEDMKKSQKSPKDIEESMRKISPKYIPREWMLVKAYSDAKDGNYDEIHNLYKIFCNPYDEQSSEIETKYYKKAPNDIYTGYGKAGVAFMS